jgi:hypothetical protein
MKFPSVKTPWTQADAIELCVKVEAICTVFGCHVALTGGSLYKQGPRKDCDLLFYRIRQQPGIKLNELWDALKLIGLDYVSGFGFCQKATYQGKPVDCFFPEEKDGDPYNSPEEEIAMPALVNHSINLT